MADQVIVRTVKEYFEEFVHNGLGQNKSKETIKQELLDAFHEEMHGLMCFRLKTDNLQIVPPTPENRRKVENVMKQAFQKWAKLCGICRLYKETRGMITPEDLKWGEDRDASEEADYNEDDVGDDGLPISEEDE